VTVRLIVGISAAVFFLVAAGQFERDHDPAAALQALAFVLLALLVAL
jgi:hypothetical protein